jgi:hypothetical protein
MDNPLAELISDDVYDLLCMHRLINNKSLRDFQIRKQFLQLRKIKVSAIEAIATIKECYPYLQINTIRKIVYGIYSASTKEKYKV